MSKIAVFIDAENVDPNYAAQIFQCAESQGEVVLKEIYGAGIALNEWAEPILRYALHMNLTLKPNKFKNSSDIALVIGAMDLLLHCARRACLELGDAPGRRGLEEELADTVLIASSDSDFSCLSLRLRTAGLRVIGMGSAEKTNPMWPKACTDFVPFTPLPQSPEAAPPPAEPAPQPAAEPQSTAKKKELPKPVLTEKVAASHTGRVEKVSAFIEERLKENGGRMTVSILFGFLNEMPDYRFDQRHSKRKPLDYLTRQYRDRFRFEEDPEGRQWITNLPVTLLPQEPELPEPETPQEEPVEEPSAAEEVTEQLREEPVPPEEPASPEEPEEPEAPQPSEPEPYEPAPESPLPGVPEEVVRQIQELRRESTNNRVFYNKLRKAYGDAQGRKYFQLVKKHKIGV